MNEEQQRKFQTSLANEWHNDMPAEVKADFENYENIVFTNSYAIIEKKNYERAKIMLAGTSYNIITFTQDGRLSMRSCGRFVKFLLTFVAKDNDSVELYLGNIRIKLSQDDAEKLLKYKDRIQSVALEELTKAVLTTSKQIVLNDPVLVKNYIVNVPNYIFFSPKLLIQIDALLNLKHSAIEPFLMSNRIQHLSYVKVDVEFSVEQYTVSMEYDDRDVIFDYYLNHFLRLVEYFQEKLNLDNEIVIASVYYSIFRLLPKVLSDLFISEWGQSPLQEGLSLANAIDYYYQHDLMEYDNLKNLAQYTCFLMTKYNILPSTNYTTNLVFIIQAFIEYQKTVTRNDYISRLSQVETEPSLSISASIDDVDMMSGFEFENFIAHLFRKMGYTILVTKASGDQGIDVIIERNAKKYGIQTKCYSGVVGNSAIQEAVAGKEYYKLDNVMVITNRHFSKSAIELASANNVILWDRDMLKEKLKTLQE